MIALLNIIPLLIILSWLLVWGWFAAPAENREPRTTRRGTAYCVIGMVGSLLLYSVLQPSYLHKGEVRRNSVPAFEQSGAVIENRVRRTNADEHYRRAQEMHEKFMAGDQVQPK